jgi:beta-lactamase class A
MFHEKCKSKSILPFCIYHFALAVLHSAPLRIFAPSRALRFISSIPFVISVLWAASLIRPSIAEELPVDQSTSATLEKIASAVPGTLGYCVMTVDGELIFSRNAAVSFPQASAIKIPILLEALAQREAGNLDWNKRITIEKANQVGGTGVLASLSDNGSQLSIGDLAVLMILVSDNTATNILIEHVGMPHVTTRMASLGCPNTKLQRVMMDTAAAARGEENLSTPAEAARIMQILAQGEFLNRQASNEALAILRKPKSTAVRKAIPAEIPVASKPGAIPGVATEWALVESPERPYVIALMGKDGKETEFVRAFTEITECVHHDIAEQQ